MLDEDKIVMYLVVRESLGMSPGKLAAQAGHAVDKFRIKWHECVVRCIYDQIDSRPIDDKLNEDLLLVEGWKKSGSTKVTLGADEKEWTKLKEEFRDNCYIVIDAGHTELSPNTETVMSFWPMKKSSRPKILKKLQVLK